MVTQLFRSHGTFSVAKSGQTWWPLVLYPQNVGVARLGRRTRSTGRGWSLEKNLGEQSHSLFTVAQRGRRRRTMHRNGQSLHLQEDLKYIRCSHIQHRQHTSLYDGLWKTLFILNRVSRYRVSCDMKAVRGMRP